VEAFSYWCSASPVGDLLVRSARLYPERAALVLPEARRTHAELREGSIDFARGLLALGVKPGEHVGLLSLNSVQFVEAFFGAAMLGCVVVPLNARHKSAEIGYIIDNAQLACILTTAGDDGYTDFSQMLRGALPSLARAPDPGRLSLPEVPHLRSAVLLRGDETPGFVGRLRFDRMAQGVDEAEVEAARRRVRVRDTALILYTSGTTAHPKGCMLSHEALTRGPVERAQTTLASGEHDVTWSAGPLFHIGSLGPFLGAIGAGGTYLTDVYFEPGRALALMAKEGVTTAWPWFPAIVQGLLDHPTFDPGRLAGLRTVLLICPPAQAARVQALFPSAQILQACGMTETAGIFALSDRFEPAAKRATTQGKAVPGVEVRIVDIESGRDVEGSQVGEILVRGYCVMEGYYRDAAKTAATVDPDRWLHTGDLYCRQPDGNLVFHGRLKDMLKVGGENVATMEVEAFLCEHPAVKLAEVVGMPDDRLDEVPVAFVELRPDQNVSAEELIEFCKGRIASYKIPRAVYFMTSEAWPMSATKVDKRALRGRLAELRNAGR
jgi:acyl-CoA synthetase (AMP-forming)/AMP-acid ligase II